LASATRSSAGVMSHNAPLHIKIPTIYDVEHSLSTISSCSLVCSEALGGMTLPEVWEDGVLVAKL
jgi:hypothetical protein